MFRASVSHHQGVHSYIKQWFSLFYLLQEKCREFVNV